MLIGTAVVGATTMIFSIVMVLTEEASSPEMLQYLLPMMHPPSHARRSIAGGAIIYWFYPAPPSRPSPPAPTARVEYIKANIKLDGSSEKASIKDSKKVVEICTQYAQKGMFNIFLTVYFSTLAFACLESYFFIGYLLSIAIFGLYQAIFMANAGGAWDIE